MDEKLINYLNKIANCTAPEDELSEGEYFNPYDCWGGNADDIYFGGIDAGRIELARELLKKFFGHVELK